jgi:hypothetical protein
LPLQFGVHWSTPLVLILLLPLSGLPVLLEPTGQKNWLCLSPSIFACCVHGTNYCFSSFESTAKKSPASTLPFSALPRAWASTSRLPTELSIRCSRKLLRVYVNLDRAIGTANGYGLDGREVGVRVTVRATNSVSPQRPDRIWRPPNLPSNANQELFHLRYRDPEVHLPTHKTDHLPPPNTEDKKTRMVKSSCVVLQNPSGHTRPRRLLSL